MKTKKRPAKSARAKLLRRNPRKVLAKRKVRRAQPVHKRILLHPVTILILLCTGVFIVGWTYQVIAANFTVNADVPALPLEEGATITYPQDGATITTTPITVSGLCPDGSYIKLYDNGLFSGVDWCSPSGAFQIETDLFNGKNTLLAEDFNVTDEQGPVTPSVSVTYQPATGSRGSSIAANPAPPLLLTSDFHYQTFLVGSNFTWPIGIQGGTPPYDVTTDWGDGQTSTATYAKAMVFQITHQYKGQGYYVIKVYATDSGGDQRLLQLATLVKLPGAVGVISTTNHGSTAGSAKQNPLITFFAGTGGWLWLAWPSFIIVLLMMLSFWLGERQEYQDLLRKRRSARLRGQSYRHS
jgi:hypothetical protein